MARTYVIGIPVAVTINELGTVTLDFDLSDAPQGLDPVDPDAISDDQYEADTLALSDAAARLGNCFTTTIHPAQPTA